MPLVFRLVFGEFRSEMNCTISVSCSCDFGKFSVYFLRGQMTTIRRYGGRSNHLLSVLVKEFGNDFGQLLLPIKVLLNVGRQFVKGLDQSWPEELATLDPNHLSGAEVWRGSHSQQPPQPDSFLAKTKVCSGHSVLGCFRNKPPTRCGRKNWEITSICLTLPITFQILQLSKIFKQLSGNPPQTNKRR